MSETSTAAPPNRTTQTAALVNEQGGPVNIVNDHPIPTPSDGEVLAKVLYTGVCQSDLHTAKGTASGPSGAPITQIKLPHVGGHEGVARIVSLGPAVKTIDNDIRPGRLVGVRFAARVCHRCEYCLAGQEQYCARLENHLHHHDGAFQEFVRLDATYLTLLPEDVDLVAVGPTLCAGLTSYKAVLNAGLKPGQWMVVVGAAGGLGHFAIQYARAFGLRVIALDAGASKKDFVLSLGAEAYIDILTTPDPIPEVKRLTDSLGAHGVLVAAGSPKAYESSAEMLRPGGTMSCCGIAPDYARIKTPAAMITIKNLKIVGNLIGSAAEALEAVDFVRRGAIRPKVQVREFKELPVVYEQLEKGEIEGRVVLKVATDE